MGKKLRKTPESRPVLIEVPKPVNQMSQDEVNEFVDEIMQALADLDESPSCPKCGSQSGLREIFYGLPNEPIDEMKYAKGRCCVSDSDPTIKCLECGWVGEYVNNMPGASRQIKVVELADISKMADKEIDTYAKRI